MNGRFAYTKMLSCRRAGTACWPLSFDETERRFGPIGVAGVYGVGDVVVPDELTQPLGAERIGWVVDRGRELRDGPELPARVATLDELLVVVWRDAGLRFDPALGFHFYGADLCLQARERGLAVVAVGAPLPSQFAELWAVTGVLSKRRGFCTQVGASIARGDAMRDRRPRESGARPGQCRTWAAIDGLCRERILTDSHHRGHREHRVENRERPEVKIVPRH